jgi:hypothetical protein
MVTRLQCAAEEVRAALDILRSERIIERHITEYEFPDAEAGVNRPDRAQRRAAAAQKRKKKR